MKNTMRLSYIPHDKAVTVKKIESNGAIRRRLLDLGFVCGNSVVPLFSDFKKNITAYRVNGAIIALRQDDANSIFVEVDEEF